MELALSLGDPSKPFSSFLDKVPQKISNDGAFCCNMPPAAASHHHHHHHHHHHPSLPLQFHLLPPSPSPSPSPPPPPPHHLRSFHCTLPPRLSIDDEPEAARRGLDVNRTPWETMAAAADHDEEAAAASPNSSMSCFQLEFGVRSSKRDHSEEERERASSRTSDDEENGSTRKKLRLSKDQSAFLEESFKEHSTLNPKQKLALAKQLNLRPRQVEVWFQNRRARTKLKQTEVDCEYLKRCCETLTEENRRLQKEVQELRALKSSNPFYMQLPATTLTMCPSCERVATTTTTSAATNTAKLFPYSPPHGQTHQPA